MLDSLWYIPVMLHFRGSAPPPVFIRTPGCGPRTWAHLDVSGGLQAVALAPKVGHREAVTGRAAVLSPGQQAWEVVLSAALKHDGHTYTHNHTQPHTHTHPVHSSLVTGLQVCVHAHSPFCFLRILSTRPLICRYSSHSLPAEGAALLHSGKEC